MNRAERRRAERPQRRDSVCVGFVRAGVEPLWAKSYRHVLVADAAGPRRIVGELERETSGAHVPSGRSKIVRDFLAHPAKPDWLWFVDTDATFAPDVLERLVAAADPKVRPIVGALAFGVRVATDDDGNDLFDDVGASPLRLFPTIYFFGEHGTQCLEDYPPDQLVRVHGTGAHCLLIHRSVLADERWFDDPCPLPWFQMRWAAGEEVSEDTFFCVRAGAMGYPIHVHTGIRTGHVKQFVASETAYILQRQQERARVGS